MKIVLQKDIKDVVFRKLIFYRKDLHPKHKMYCDCTDCTYVPEEDENGFLIYNLPIDDVRQKLKHKSDRWRLYKDEKPVDVQITNSKGAQKWVTFYPWEYSINSVQTGVESNGEAKYEYKIFWKEIITKNDTILENVIVKDDEELKKKQ